MTSDSELLREIESIFAEHLGSIKKEALARVLKLQHADRDKAWEEIESAIDGYGGDMQSDATHWLRRELHDYSSRRWRAATSKQRPC